MSTLHKFFDNPAALVVIDLDGTLVDERAYLFPAYEAIASFLGPITGISSESLSDWLKHEFDARGRKNLFQIFFAHFGIHESNLKPILEILRSVELPTPLEIAYWATMSLPEAKSSIAILTNGNPEQQRNKIRQSNLDLVRPNVRVICANEVDPKPSPRALLDFMLESQVSRDLTLLIGDSEVDQECARLAGVKFIRATHQGVENEGR